jgi:hypothetical protein
VEALSRLWPRQEIFASGRRRNTARAGWDDERHRVHAPNVFPWNAVRTGWGVVVPNFFPRHTRDAAMKGMNAPLEPFQQRK